MAGERARSRTRLVIGVVAAVALVGCGAAEEPSGSTAGSSTPTVTESIVADVDLDVRLVAHRGNSSVAPENTVAAVRAALEVEPAPEYVEVDVHRTRDDVLVVIHDKTLDRTTDGAGLVKVSTWSDLEGLSAGYADEFGNDFADEPIPQLADVLEAVEDTTTDVMIELKAEGTGSLTVDLLRSRGELERHVVASFDHRILAEVESAASEVRTLFLTKTGSPGHLDRAVDVGAEIIGVNHAEVDADLMDAATSRGLLVWVWTVNAEPVAQLVLGLGVDAIITDRPGDLPAAVGWLRRDP